MKHKIERNGKTVKVTIYVNNNNIYRKVLKEILDTFTFNHPYDELRFVNDVENYLKNADHYIKMTETFERCQFYSKSGKHIANMNKKVSADVRKHLLGMI